MFGKYVTINCLYAEEPIRVWVICTPDTPISELKQQTRKMIIDQMEKQLKENE